MKVWMDKEWMKVLEVHVNEVWMIKYCIMDEWIDKLLMNGWIDEVLMNKCFMMNEWQNSIPFCSFSVRLSVEFSFIIGSRKILYF